MRERENKTYIIDLHGTQFLHLNNSFQVNQDVRQLDWKSLGIKEEKIFQIVISKSSWLSAFVQVEKGNKE